MESVRKTLKLAQFRLTVTGVIRRRDYWYSYSMLTSAFQHVSTIGNGCHIHGANNYCTSISK